MSWEIMHDDVSISMISTMETVHNYLLWLYIQCRWVAFFAQSLNIHYKQAINVFHTVYEKKTRDYYLRWAGKKATTLIWTTSTAHRIFSHFTCSLFIFLSESTVNERGKYSKKKWKTQRKRTIQRIFKIKLNRQE